MFVYLWSMWLIAVSAACVADEHSARLAPLAAHGLLLSAVQVGARIVAVGEYGHVLLSDDQGERWRQAREVPTRTTLTDVFFIDDRRGWAVGHGGQVLATLDGGDTWTVQYGNVDGADSLFSVHFSDAERGLAVGPFGYAIRTVDGGKRWSQFYVSDGEDGERHLNGIFAGNAGRLLIAAEIGGVFVSDDHGDSWRLINLPYEGSVWGGRALADGSLIVWGMAGHALRSQDNGETWVELVTHTDQSLTSGVELPGGGLALTGTGGAVARANPAFEFTVAIREDRQLAADALAIEKGLLLFTTSGPQVFPLP